MQLSHAEMIEAFAGSHWIGPDGLGAFKARLRKLQGEGVPEGANPGKGKRVAYTIPMLVELAVALEFLQAGLSPAEAGALIKAGRGEVIALSLFAIFPQDSGREPVIIFSPEALRNLKGGRGETNLLGALSYFSRSALADHFSGERDYDPITGVAWRWLIIELRPLMFNLMAHIDDVLDSEDGIAAASFAALAQNLEASIARIVKLRLNNMIVWPRTEDEDGDT